MKQCWYVSVDIERGSAAGRCSHMLSVCVCMCVRQITPDTRLHPPCTIRRFEGLTHGIWTLHLHCLPFLHVHLSPSHSHTSLLCIPPPAPCCQPVHHRANNKSRSQMWLHISPNKQLSCGQSTDTQLSIKFVSVCWCEFDSVSVPVQLQKNWI